MIRVFRERDRASLSNVPFEIGSFNVQFKDVDSVKGYGVFIDARVTNSEDLMKLLIVTDAVKQGYPKFIKLFLPCFPGASQDHRSEGNALTVKIVADIINAQGYDRVGIIDPYSSVAPALIDNCIVVDHTDLITDALFKATGKMPNEFDGIISSTPERYKDYSRRWSVPLWSRESYELSRHGQSFLVLENFWDQRLFIEQGGTCRNCRLVLWATHGPRSMNDSFDSFPAYDQVLCLDSTLSADLDRNYYHSKVTVTEIPRLKFAMI